MNLTIKTYNQFLNIIIQSYKFYNTMGGRLTMLLSLQTQETIGELFSFTFQNCKIVVRS